MGHYDEFYEEMGTTPKKERTVTKYVKDQTVYTQNGLEGTVVNIKEFDDGYPVTVYNKELHVTIAYTTDGRYYRQKDLSHHLDLRQEEEQMEQAQPQQNIIEACGQQWEVTHSVSSEDLVNSPNHYAFFESDTGDTEAIEVIASSMTHEEFKGYCKGNALKYRLRLGKKDSIEQDLAKANKYQELYHLHKQRTLDWGLVKQQ